jgi:hypothetical protein
MNVEFEVPTAMTVKIAVLWDVTSRSLVVSEESASSIFWKEG